MTSSTVICVLLASATITMQSVVFHLMRMMETFTEQKMLYRSASLNFASIRAGVWSTYHRFGYVCTPSQNSRLRVGWAVCLLWPFCFCKVAVKAKMLWLLQYGCAWCWREKCLCRGIGGRWRAEISHATMYCGHTYNTLHPPGSLGRPNKRHGCDSTLTGRHTSTLGSCLAPSGLLLLPTDEGTSKYVCVCCPHAQAWCN